jgi:hypothetical protein
MPKTGGNPFFSETHGASCGYNRPVRLKPDSISYIKSRNIKIVA